MGLFSTEVLTPEYVPELLAALMRGDDCPLGDPRSTLAFLSWPQVSATRRISFVSASIIRFEPAATITLRRGSTGISFAIRGLDISDDGKTIRVDMPGPDFTVSLSNA